ncbi:MAG: VWA domain-containing protein, partial [Candidatus Hydrogenedentota bacterium]
MGLSLLAPLFMVGMGLLVAPYLIHQIRRPEREPMKFSSLLFIPDIKKEVIERKKIEHILLMLMRMMVLALLALAFARPYWAAPVASEFSGDAVRHMILLDNSYSMAVGDTFERAQRAAGSILGDVGEEELVGVMLFGARGEVARPLSPKNESDTIAAKTVVDEASVSSESTNYLNALETLQHHELCSLCINDDLIGFAALITDLYQHCGSNSHSHQYYPNFTQ